MYTETCPRLLVFGDSHALYCFDRIHEAEVFWLGPVTLHRAARDQLWFLDGADLSKYIVILIFGEIDVRCHLARIADQQSRPVSAIISELLDRYFREVSRCATDLKAADVIVCSVPPPADGEGLQNADFPVYGSWLERAKITIFLNQELSRRAAANNVKFLDFHDCYSLPDGRFDPSKSDGSVHVARDQTDALISRLEELIRHKLTLRTAESALSRAPATPFAVEAKKVEFDDLAVLGEKIDAFNAAAHQPQPGSVIRLSPLTVASSAPAWNYISSWPSQLSLAEAGRAQGLSVLVEASAQVGLCCAALAGHDGSTIIAEKNIPSGRSVIRLDAPRAVDVGALVIRHGPVGGRASVVVHDIAAHASRPLQIDVEAGAKIRDLDTDLLGIVGRHAAVIFDVGANIGETAERFAGLFENSIVHAFEPHPGTFKVLEQRALGSRRMHAYNCALGTSKGVLKLHSYENSAINSIHPMSTSGSQYTDGQIVELAAVSVNVEAIDAFCLEYHIATIDLLKIDTQGFEMNVLKGARGMLSQKRIRAIVAEVLFVSLYEGQCFADDVMSLMRQFGYKAFGFYDLVYDPKAGMKWGDALFVPSEFDSPRPI